MTERREKPIRVEAMMIEGSDEVCFTVVYRDSTRDIYWLPFWRALAHAFKLMWRGVDVTYVEGKS